MSARSKPVKSGSTFMDDILDTSVSAFASIAGGFARPPRDCTQIPFWFLNGVVDGPEYVRQTREMAAQGVQQSMPHPRFGMDRRDYLGPQYWAAFDQLVDAAEADGLTIHLYDEYNWSSGPAGGRVTADVSCCALGLGVRSRPVDGPVNVRFDTWDEHFMGWGRREAYLLVAIAPRREDGSIDLSRMIELPTPEASVSSVSIDVPEGRWEAMVFYTVRTVHPSPLRMGNGGIIDYLAIEPTRRFIEHTHEQYARRYRRHFGKTIPSIFYDECGPYACGPFTWTGDLPEQFQLRHGYDLRSLLPALFHDVGEMTERTRCNYWDTVAHLFTERFVGQLADWCDANGLALTGHTFEESESWMVSADVMRTLRRQQWVGMDALNGPVPFSWLTVPGSVARLTGRPLVCEAAGLLGGWGCSPRMLRQAYNRLAVAGVTHLVPHAFFQTIDNPKVECPPSFFEHNPYWSHYRQIADLTARHCWMNRQGRPTADVFVLHPQVSWWGDSAGGRGEGYPWGRPNWQNSPSRPYCEAFDAVLDTLAEQQWQATVMDEPSLNNGVLEARRVRVGPLSAGAIVLPPMRTARLSVMRRVAEFAAAGVPVVVTGELPTISVEKGRDDPELRAVVTDLASRVTRCEVADLGACLRRLTTPAVLATVAEPSLHVATRSLPGGVMSHLIHNALPSPRAVRLKLLGALPASWWDPETGATTALPDARASDDHAEVMLDLSGDHAGYVLLGAPLPTESRPVDFKRSHLCVPLDGPWTISAAAPGADAVVLHASEFDIDVPVLRCLASHPEPHADKAFDWQTWFQRDYDDKHWPVAHVARGALLFSRPESQLFRTLVPPGAVALRTPLPIAGEYAIYLDGRLLRTQLGHDDPTPGTLALDGVETGRSVLAIECASMAPDFGLTGPLRFVCKPVECSLGDWCDAGLAWFTGRVAYRTTFDVARFDMVRDDMVRFDLVRDDMMRDDDACLLDLGDVRECAEVYVNGQYAGARVWPPYQLDITSFVRPGTNELLVVVANTLSNRFSWDVLGTRGGGRPLASGLLGPVTLTRTKNQS